MKRRLTRAVFLDKDGTLIDDVPYNVDPALIALSRNAGEGLRLFKRMGYRLFVVSNQSGVALGRFAEGALVQVHVRLNELLAREEVALDGFYYCPHHPDGTVAHYAYPCDCRKPAPGMLLKAAREHGIDLSASWMIGDILNDVEAGKLAGCRTVLIDNGNETQWQMSALRTPELRAGDLSEAARLIEGLEGGQRPRSLPRSLPLNSEVS